MKVQYSAVEAKVDKMESAAEAFENSVKKDMASGNQLDVVKKMNELNQFFEEVGNAYKQIVRENNQTVRTTLTELHNADVAISSSIKAN